MTAETQTIAPAPAAPQPTQPTASLYVGELQQDVTEAMLYEIFSQIGPVSSIRICRDAITRRSLGYAYVNFHSLADGERALEALNYSLIRGHPCRIMWSQRDPSLRRSGLGNVFIKNLDKSIDNKALHDTFSAFGNILSCKVVCDIEGNSKGFGFVHFESQEAADEAIAKVNGMLLNDVKVFVGRHMTRRERQQQLEAVKSRFTNVFIKNLDDSVTDEQFRSIFGAFGEILSAVIQREETREEHDARSKGFGFVNYATHEQAQRAVDEMNGRVIAGKDVYVGRAQKKAERVEELRRQFDVLKIERMQRYHGINVYIKNLVDSVDDDRLRVEFSPYGTITSSKVMLDERGVSRGFGFVCFSTPEEAARAVTEMNGRMLLGKPLYVALAQRREERRAQLEAQYAARAQQMRFNPAAYYGPLAGNMIFPPGAPLFYPSGPQPYMIPRGGRQMSTQPYIPRSGAPSQHVGNAPQSTSGGMPAFGGIPPTQHPSTLRPMMRTPYSRGAPFAPTYQPAAGMQPGTTGSSQPPVNSFYASANGTRRPVYGPGAGPGRHVPRYGGAPNMMTGYSGPRPGIPFQQQRPLTAASLASVAPEQQRRILGERLYPLVHAQAPEQASKITGMLLEMETGDLLHLMDTPDALHAKVEEAQEVLRKHLAQVSA